MASGYAYVANGESGLLVIDVSAPSHPVVVRRLPLPSWANDLTLAGGYAYVADDSGLDVVDLANPVAPVLVGRAEAHGRVQGVALSQDFAVIGVSASNTPYEGWMAVVDVSDPRAPVIVGDAAMPWGVRGVAVSGAVAYIGSSGLVLVDLTAPSDPRILGSVGAGGYPCVRGPYAYMAAPERPGFQIVSVQCAPSGVAGSPPERPALSVRASPNPIRHWGSVRLVLPSESRVCAIIHDVAGRQVRRLLDGNLHVGPHDLAWDGRDDQGRPVPAGVYLVRASAEAGTKTARWVVVK